MDEPERLAEQRRVENEREHLEVLRLTRENEELRAFKENGLDDAEAELDRLRSLVSQQQAVVEAAGNQHCPVCFRVYLSDLGDLPLRCHDKLHGMFAALRASPPETEGTK